MTRLFNYSNNVLNKTQQVGFVNMLAIMLAVLGLPYFFLFYYLGYPKLSWLIIFFIFCYGGCIFLNKLKAYILAKIGVIFFPSFAIFIYSSIFSANAGIQFCLFGISTLPFLIFKQSQVKYILFAFLMPIFFYIFLELTSFSLLGNYSIAPIALRVCKLTSIFSTFIIIFLSMFSYFRENKRYLKSINQSREKLQLAYNKIKEGREVQRQLVQHAEYAKLVQNIAHEIKNPLQMLQGMAEIGLIKDEEKSEKNEMFSVILKAVGRINNVIQPLLLYLNKNRNNYKFTVCDIKSLVQDIVIMSKANCKAKSITLTVNDSQLSSTSIFGDQQSIGQVLINIITNAIDSIKKDSGEIKIEITNTQFNDSKVANIPAIKIDIIDNGCGIPDEKLKNIFIPYQTYKKNENNLGLGLSIVAKIIKDHHGLIKISSKLDVGTTVSIWLPINKKKIVNSSKNESQNDALFKLDDSFFED